MIKKYKLFLLLFCSILITACNDEDDDDDVAEANKAENQYFVWEGSANEEWVVDANGDKVRFEMITGYMTFGNTIYTNARVNTGETAEFSLDGEIMGAVQSVVDVNDNQIVALVAPDGTYLDIRGNEDELYIDETDIPAMLISASSMESNSKASESDTLHSLSTDNGYVVNNTSTTLPPPMPASNAFIRPDVEPQMGILRKSQ